MLRDLIKWALPVLLLSACGKELSLDSTDPASGGTGNSGGGGSTNGGLLTKVVSAAAFDTATTEYTYDTNNWLIKEVYTSSVASTTGGKLRYEYRYYRNSSGLITHYSYITNDIGNVGIDSIVYYPKYNSANSRYTSIVSYAYQPASGGPVVYDSVAYTYNSAGKVTNSEEYLNSVGTLDLVSTTTYAYNASGNLSETTQSANNGTGMTPILKLGYEYDGKKAAITLPYQEALALNQISYANSQNVLKTTVTVYSSNGTPTSVTLASTYTYNTKSQPSTATLVSQTGFQNVTYFYK